MSKKNSRSAKDVVVEKPGKSGGATKGPKNYNLSTTDSVGADEENITKVSIDSDVERALLDLILTKNQMRWTSSTVSHRISNKKLNDVYMCLMKAGFKRNQIEASMNATTLEGGDLIDALDWLCLNTPNDQLPEGFSEALQEEERKIRPKFCPSEATHDKNSSTTVAASSKENSAKQSSNEKPKSGGTNSNKQWILQYAEKSDDDDDDNDNDDDDDDPNERYLELTAKFMDAKNSASEAKQSGDQKSLKTVSALIKKLVSEMTEIESDPRFNPLIKLDNLDSMKADAAVSVGPKKNKQKEEEDLCLGLEAMMEAESQQSTSNEAQNKKKEVTKFERRDFSYTRQQWTGKSPKQFLHDWRAKHLQKATLSYEKIDMGKGLWRTKCKIARGGKDGDLIVLPEILCDNIKDAEHLSSTLALYHLCRGQSIHQLLPPPYRDVWLEWVRAEDTKKQELIQQDNKPRDQFIAKLMNEIKTRKEEEPRGDAGEGMGTVESWEDLGDDDIDDNNDDKNDASNGQSSSKKAASTKKSLPLKLLQDTYISNKKSESYERLRATREALPVFKYKDNIVETYRKNRVFIVAGETGSGKSTQVTQFILEELLFGQSSGNKALTNQSIVCTEPRRISATSLARRVCDELGESQGPGGRRSLCGYQIHLEMRTSVSTRVVYCTTGVVLRQIQSDPALSNVTCVLLDEVHERGADSDFLMIHLRRLLTERPDFHLVLMSATLDAHKFSQYFNGCPVLSVEGRTFPVQVHYVEDIIERLGYVVEDDSPYALRLDKIIQRERARLEVTGRGGQTYSVQADYSKQDVRSLDYSGLDADRYTLRTRNTITRLNPERVNLDLILSLINMIDTSGVELNSTGLPSSGTGMIDWSGAVLIFMPGLSHIRELCELLQADRNIGRSGRYKIVPLHSVLSMEEQAQAFITPPDGVRKIVVSTNVAETGVTIPDVTVVIDSGRVKEKRYHETTQISELREGYVSQASSDQRAGRAGRVREGVCYRLYTLQTYQLLPKYSVPEILRIPLEQLCLHIMKSSLGHPAEILGEALDAPNPYNVARAMSILREIGACETSNPSLTPLGQHLALLPMDARLGKMLIYSAILGCLEPASVIAASMTDKSPFLTSVEKRDQVNQAKARLSLADSDHLTFYNAYIGWKESCKSGGGAEKNYCQKNFLKRSSLIDIENQAQEFFKTVCSLQLNTTITEIPNTYKSKSLSTSFRPSSECIVSKGMSAVLKACITAGFYPNVARTTYTKPVDGSTAGQHVCVGQTAQGLCQVYPGSVNRALALNGWIVFQEKMKYTGTQTYLNETTVTSPYALLLFGGDISVQHSKQLATVDDWISFKAPAKTFVVFKETRRLIDQLLMKKLDQPAMKTIDEPLLGVLLELLVSESKQK